MIREYFLPNLSEFRYFCFPHSTGHYAAPDDHNVDRPDGLRDFSLHYIAGGSGYIELDGVTHQLGKGDGFLHYPNQRMRYYRSEDDPWNIYWVQFYGDSLPAFLLENGCYQSSIWVLKNTALLQAAFEELHNEIEQHNFMRASRISALTYSILVEFVSNALPFTPNRSANHMEKIAALLPDMQKNAHQPFALNEWAEKVGLTPNYFCTLFKKTTRMTPISYVTKCRMQASKQLLLSDPSMPVREVALQSGYPGISYFNKKFYESEGMTPSEFRQVHLKA